MTFANDIRELMNAYDTMREKWLEQFGTDNGFNEWFAEKLGL